MTPENRKIFNNFKKEFHKAKDAAKLISGDNFSFSFNLEMDKEVKSQLELPEEHKISRFAFCVKPFADPASSLYINKILNLIIELASAYLHLDENKLQQRTKEIETDSFSLNIGNKQYSALDMYLVYAKGEYFEEDKDSLEILSALKTNQMTEELTFYQFYCYSYDVFNFCGYLYSLIREIDKIFPSICIPNEDENNICMFCKTTEGKFTSEEHVFPESLGNTEIILPIGFVCDECNNGVLSQLDQKLVEHDVISFLKVYVLPVNPKTGQFTKAKYQNLTIEKTHPRKIRLTRQSGLRKTLIENKQADGINFTINTVGRAPFDPVVLARPLYKIGLELVCLEHGIDRVLHERYDLARDFVMGKEKKFPNNLLINQKFEVSISVSAQHYLLEPSGTIFEINIFGIPFMINLEPYPKIEIKYPLEAINAKCFSLDK